MCQMILSRCGAPKLSHSTLAKLIAMNPHGGGLAIAAAGRLLVRRERHVTVEAVQGWLAKVPPDACVLLHLRQATCGPLDDFHVQPFCVDKAAQCAFAHNGTLAGWGDEQRSDSAAVVARILVPLAGAGIERLHQELRRVWHEGNRFALLDARGHVALVGEQEGVWRGQAWWSNPKQLF